MVRRARWRGPHGALLQLGHWIAPCSVGRSGMTASKREGDGATPIAVMKIIAGYFRRDRVAHSRLAFGLQPISPDLGWGDAPADPRYNRPVRLPFGDGHELMHRRDGLYDFCLVLDWNYFPRARNRGSAIFLHHCRPDGGPTVGCIALTPADMRRLLRLGAIGRTVRTVG